jgi:hypothetical protein
MMLARGKSVAAAPARPARPARASRSPARPPSALFGGLFGGGKPREKSQRELDKEDQMRVQMEIIEARRSGSSIRQASERRQKVAETLAERKNARALEKQALARGEMPESLGKWRNYKNKEDADADGRSGRGGIVLPLNPLGMREYDEGELSFLCGCGFVASFFLPFARSQPSTLPAALTLSPVFLFPPPLFHAPLFSVPPNT